MAEQFTVTITVRPTYASATTVREEISESLRWLWEDHNAITLEWGEVYEARWHGWPEEGEGD